MAEDFKKNDSQTDTYRSKTDLFLDEMNESLAKQVEEHSTADRFSAGIKDAEAVTTFKSSGQYEKEENADAASSDRSSPSHEVRTLAATAHKDRVGGRGDTLYKKENNLSLTKEDNEKTTLKKNNGILPSVPEKPMTIEDYLDSNITKPKKKKWPLAGKILAGLAVILLFFVGAGAYYINFVLDHATIVEAEKESSPIPVEQETFDQDEKQEGAVEMDPEEVLWGKLSKLARKEEDVVNILLVGEEDLGEEEYGRGRTDCMIIATISKKENALKLTSLMRDMYVQIPGFSDNKLNAAYKNGGIALLEKTIELNFGVTVDGYVLVDFDAFENVIDALGGVEIKLSKIEADYLNKRNYISRKKYRNVKPGKQILNGNQARGYARIRFVRTANGLTDDWGRNYRQRKVLNAVFQEYKSKNPVELVALLPDILSLVTTDLTKKDMLGYIGTILTINADKLETMSVPVQGSFTMPYINGMSVLLPNLETNQEELHDFLFGSDEKNTSDKKSKKE